MNSVRSRPEGRTRPIRVRVRVGVGVGVGVRHLVRVGVSSRVRVLDAVGAPL